MYAPADALAQLLTIPPYVVGSTVLVLSSYASDRLQTRGLFVIGGSCTAGVGYMYAFTLPSSAPLC